MPVSVRQAAKEEAIKTEYAKLASERKYSRVYIIDLIAQKFFLADNTIERIVWGEYDARRARASRRAQQMGTAA